MLDEQIDYLTDALRTRLLRQSAAASKGFAVADLGCGSGILGLLCFQSGARTLYFIERGSAIEVARETVKRSGFAEKSFFIRGVTQQIELPEPVDLVICDHVGYFGFDYGIFGLLKDARERFLKPGGIIIPSRLDIHFAPLQSAKVWEKVARWQSEAVPSEFNWVHELAVNQKHCANLNGDDLLASPALLASVDFLGDIPEVIKSRFVFAASRDGVVHGIAGFFNCQLSGDVWMTNAPGAEGAIDRPQAILPLPEPVPVKKGDSIEITLAARPSDDFIAWNVSIPSAAKSFRQSTFNGQLLNGDEIRRLAPTNRPLPKRTAVARALVLGYCDGVRTNAEIVDAVLSDHPGLMPSATEIRNLVREVLRTETK